MIKTCLTRHRLLLMMNLMNLLVLQICHENNQYEQKSDVLYTFTGNKSYAYLLNDEPSNLVFLKTYNTEFYEIIITFTDQIGRPLEIEVKVNLKLPKARKYVKEYVFFIICEKYKKKLLDKGLDDS